MGTRLDYTLVDNAISEYIDKDNNQRLRCCDFPADKDFNGEEAAFHAATASGKFEGASYVGGGIAEPSHMALETQFGEAHTGIIYTPPSYSDHVAVSLLLNKSWRSTMLSSTLVLDSKCSDTKKSQPHKSQRSISSFFQVNGNGGNKSSSSKSSSSLSSSSGIKRKSSGTSERRLKMEAQKKKGTIFSHFSK
jgi:hypothetical protein